MKPDIILYTAIFGDVKDQLYELPRWGDAYVECHAYVDTVEKPKKHKTGWILRPPAFTDQNDSRRKARKHKALAHELYPDVPITIWCDGTMTPYTSPKTLCRRYLPEDLEICTFRHSERTCIYQEAEYCARNKRGDVAKIRKQIAAFKKEGYPYHNGLAETMVVIRKLTDDTKAFNELWWACIENGSERDQLSFDYAIWKLGLDYAVFPLDYRHQTDFWFRSHW